MRTLRIVAAATLLLALVPVAGSAAPVGRCRSSQLSLRYVSSEGAAGSTYYRYVVENVSGEDCHIGGFFDVKVLKNHHRVPADIRHNNRSHRYDLPPGEKVRFVLQTSNTPPGCMRAGHLRLTPPDNTVGFRKSAHYFRFCQHEITVYAIRRHF